MATKDISDLEVCKAIRDAKAMHWTGADNEDCWPYTLLIERTKQPFKVCWRAMERAAGRDYIEYGVSLRTGWLTDKGNALIDGL